MSPAGVTDALGSGGDGELVAPVPRQDLLRLAAIGVTETGTRGNDARLPGLWPLATPPPVWHTGDNRRLPKVSRARERGGEVFWEDAMRNSVLALAALGLVAVLAGCCDECEEPTCPDTVPRWR
jgi:hypothetical protein